MSQDSRVKCVSSHATRRVFLWLWVLSFGLSPVKRGHVTTHLSEILCRDRLLVAQLAIAVW